ncbi:preprotein translocase subunit SecE [Candidatus Saccharibacteria bacterium]|nr:preprotein translocase subunit SecE [Candidatus Saccharibacteria bacterium]
MAKPKITRIKAGETSRKTEEEQAPITRKKVVVEDKKQEKKKAKEARKIAKAEKKAAAAKEGKKVFVLFRPFVAFGRYLRNSWREIRQVRWPNRKATWKMVGAVLVYTALFVIFISLIDLFFKWLFSLIIK